MHKQLEPALVPFHVFQPVSLIRNNWDELLEMIKFQGERLQDAEAIHKCLQDLMEALVHTEVIIMLENIWIGYFVSAHLLCPLRATLAVKRILLCICISIIYPGFPILGTLYG